MPRKKIDENLPELYLIYKITNLINNKVYIGAHKTRDKNDYYMGSGDLIKTAIKKYGKINFKKEILYELNSAEEMYCKEREVVQLGKGFYNLVNGGGFPLIFTKEIKGKIGKANSIHQLGKGNSQYGKMWINNGIENIKIKKEGIIPISYIKGRLVDKSKIYKIPKGKDSSNSGKYYVNNGLKNLFLKTNEIIPEGYIKGRLINFDYKHKNSNYNSGENNSQFGNKWITDGVKNILLKKGENISAGFKLGRSMPTKWIWITNGIKNLKNAIEIEIPSGYRRGKVKINNSSKMGV